MSEGIPAQPQPQFEISNEVATSVTRAAAALAGLEPGPDGPMVATQMAGNYADGAHRAYGDNPTPATTAELFLASAMLAGASVDDARTMSALDVMGSLEALDQTEATAFSGMIVDIVRMRHGGAGIPDLQDRINNGIGQNLRLAQGRDTLTATNLEMAILAAGVGVNAGRSQNNPWYGELQQSLMPPVNKES